MIMGGLDFYVQPFGCNSACMALIPEAVSGAHRVADGDFRKVQAEENPG
jgi:hypothetical protein